MSLELSEQEQKILEIINDYRTKPNEFDSKFKDYKKKFNKKSAEAKELNTLISNLSTRKSASKLIHSPALTKAAKALLNKYLNNEIEFANQSPEALQKHIDDNVNSHKNAFEILYEGPKLEIIPKALMSDFDPNSYYNNALENSEFKYIGIATGEYEGNEELCVLLCEEIEDSELSNNNNINNVESNMINLGKDVSDAERELIREINKLRMNPVSCQKQFSVVSKMLKRLKKTANAEELMEIADGLKDRPKCNKLKISLGLCQAADALLAEVTNPEKLKKKSDKEMTIVLNNYLESYENVFELLDKGDTGNILARCMVSDYDPQRIYRDALFNEKYRYVGFATKNVTTDDDEEDVNIIILAENVVEKPEMKAKAEQEEQKLEEQEKNDNPEEEQVVEELKEAVGNKVPNNVNDFIEETINKLRTEPESFTQSFKDQSAYLTTSKSSNEESKNKGEQLLKISEELPSKVKVNKLIISESLNSACAELLRVVSKESVNVIDSNDSSSIIKKYKSKVSQDLSINEILPKYVKRYKNAYELEDAGRLDQIVFRFYTSEFDFNKLNNQNIHSDKYKYIGFAASPDLEKSDNTSTMCIFILVEELVEYTEIEKKHLELLKDFPIREISTEELLEDISTFRKTPSLFEKNFKMLSEFIRMTKENDKEANELNDLSQNLKNVTPYDKFKISSGLCQYAEYILKKDFEIISSRGYGNKELVRNQDIEINRKDLYTYIRKVKEFHIIEDTGRTDFIIPRVFVEDDSNQHNRNKINGKYFKYIGIHSIPKSTEGNMLNEYKTVIVLGNGVEEFNDPIKEERDEPVKNLSSEELGKLINKLRINPKDEELNNLFNKSIESMKKRKDLRDRGDRLVEIKDKLINENNDNKQELIKSEGLTSFAEFILSQKQKNNTLTSIKSNNDSKDEHYKLLTKYIKKADNTNFIFDQGRVDFTIPRLLVSEFDTDNTNKDNLNSNNKRYFGIATLASGTFKNKTTEDGIEVDDEDDTEENINTTFIILADNVIEGVNYDLLNDNNISMHKLPDYELLNKITVFNNKPFDFSNEFKLLGDEINVNDKNKENTNISERLHELGSKLKNFDYNNPKEFKLSPGLLKASEDILNNNVNNVIQIDNNSQGNIVDNNNKEIKDTLLKHIVSYKGLNIIVDKGRKELLIPRIIENNNNSISDLKQKLKETLLLNTNYNYIGFYSIDQDNNNSHNIVIFAEEIKEKQIIDVTPEKELKGNSEIIDNLNKLRTNPPEMKQNFKDAKDYLLRSNASKEVIKNLDKEIYELNTQEQGEKVKINRSLCRIAKAILKDYVKGATTNDVNNIHKQDKKIMKFIKEAKNLGIVSHEGRFDLMLPQIIVDEKDLSQFNKWTLIGKKIKYIGIATHPLLEEDKSDPIYKHKPMKNEDGSINTTSKKCVIVLAEDVIEKDFDENKEADVIQHFLRERIAEQNRIKEEEKRKEDERLAQLDKEEQERQFKLKLEQEEKERKEKEEKRIAAEKERERLEQERKEKEDKERKEKEEKDAQEKKEREEKERKDREEMELREKEERLNKEKAEKEKAEKEKADKEKAEKEKADKEKEEKEKAGKENADKENDDKEKEIKEKFENDNHKNVLRSKQVVRGGNANDHENKDKKETTVHDNKPHITKPNLNAGVHKPNLGNLNNFTTVEDDKKNISTEIKDNNNANIDENKNTTASNTKENDTKSNKIKSKPVLSYIANPNIGTSSVIAIKKTKMNIIPYECLVQKGLVSANKINARSQKKSYKSTTSLDNEDDIKEYFDKNNNKSVRIKRDIILTSSITSLLLMIAFKIFVCNKAK